MGLGLGLGLGMAHEKITTGNQKTVDTYLCTYHTCKLTIYYNITQIINPFYFLGDDPPRAPTGVKKHTL